MRYAIIINGIVDNVIEAAEPVAQAIAAAKGGQAVEAQSGNVGDAYASGAFTAAALATPVPPRVTRRQARQALLLAGLLDDVQPAIDAISDATQRALAQIEWDDSQDFERQRPLLVTLATAMGLSSGQLDDLFRTAGRL